MPTLKSEQQVAFLAAYEECGRKSPAARAAGVLPQRFPEWIKDPAFAERFEATAAGARKRLFERARSVGVADRGVTLRVLIGQARGRMQTRAKEA